MPVRQSHYEEALADYSNLPAVIALLKQHRPYLEMLPSLRRANESLAILPLPTVRIKLPLSQSVSHMGHGTAPMELQQLPCDLAILMCDPDWKVKTGIEIFVYIHHPQEDFSELLGRWRQTQVWLDRGYQWSLPPHYQHILGEEANDLYPLFILFPETPDRIKRGLQGARLPYIVRQDHGHDPEQQDPNSAPYLEIDDSGSELFSDGGFPSSDS